MGLDRRARVKHRRDLLGRLAGPEQRAGQDAVELHSQGPESAPRGPCLQDPHLGQAAVEIGSSGGRLSLGMAQ